VSDNVQSASDTQPQATQRTLRGHGKARKKDARNKEKESARWNPRKWTAQHADLIARHAVKHALVDLQCILGVYEGAMVGAEVKMWYAESLSVARLRALGVKLIGDEANEKG
jgi:hypothetical protein